MAGKSLGARFEEFYSQSKMLLRLSTKPRWDEFWQLFKIIMIIMFALGFIGFFIRILMQSLMGVLGR